MRDLQEKNELLELLKNRSGTIFEHARAMRTLCTQHGFTQASLAKYLGISQSCVGNKIRLLQFSDSEQQQIVDLGLSERHARTLLRIQGPKRMKMIATVGNMELTVQQTEELVEKYSNEGYFAYSVTHAAPQPINAVHYVSQMQSGADRLRASGYKTTCLTESGDGWIRITVTIVE